MHKTHDYSDRSWGHDYHIGYITDDGLSISLTGWGMGIKTGDYIVIKNGSDTTRYKFESIDYHRDPHDMWKGSLSFAPRENKHS